MQPQTVSSYERGVNAVDDERAETIAGAFGMDVVEVRRGLGLWVPEDQTTAAAGREQRVEQVLAKLRVTLSEDGLLSRREIDDLVRYGRFLITSQVTERQDSVDE